jgi:hypothetical protein
MFKNLEQIPNKTIYIVWFKKLKLVVKKFKNDVIASFTLAIEAASSVAKHYLSSAKKIKKSFDLK